MSVQMNSKPLLKPYSQKSRDQDSSKKDSASKSKRVQNLNQSFNEVNKTNPLPFIKKGIDAYIYERKTKKQKNLTEKQKANIVNKSQINARRYDDIVDNLAELYKYQQVKKRIMVGSNKVVSQAKILEVFEPYRNQIEKLNLNRNLPSQQSDSPFSMAFKQLGIFYQYPENKTNQLIPSKNINTTGHRSIQKKQQGKQKMRLKPISQSHLKKQRSEFLNVERINLIDGQLKLRQHSPQTSMKPTFENFVFEQKKGIEKNIRKIQESKRQKQIQLQKRAAKNPQKKQKQSPKQLYLRISQTLRQSHPCNEIQLFPNEQYMKNLKFKPKSEQDKQKFQEYINNSKLIKIEGQQDQQTTCNIQDQTESQEKLSPTFMTRMKDNGSKNAKTMIRRKKQFQLPFETYYYRDLIWKMNYSNKVFIQTPVQYEHRLKAYIGKGNNSSMIMGLIKRRTWFAFTDKIQDANFVWTQLKNLTYFKKQKKYSEPNTPITTNRKIQEEEQTPQQESINLKTQKTQTKQLKQPVYCHRQKSRILISQDYDQYNQYFEKYINFQLKSSQQFQNRQKVLKYQKMIKIPYIKQQKLQNHLINNYVIGNKKALFNTMSNYYTSIGQDVFNYLPLTFHIQAGLQDESYYKFLKYYYKRNKQMKSSNSEIQSPKKKQRNAWIVKPGQNSNRGNGIQVCLTLDEIKNIVRKNEKYSDGSSKTYIIQSYIDKPLLYQKRKFDIRHFIMMTCINGKMKGYWYRNGYIRTTSNQYSLKNNSDKVHLTNDAVQKRLQDYGKYEKGNKISYEDLQNFMVKGGKNKNFNFNEQIYPQMKKISTDIMKACSGGIDPEKLQNNFQIYGLDFMIDHKNNVWLIQVNSNPCLQLSCPLLGSIIPRMIQNALELTMDCLYPPPVRYCPKGVHYYKNLEQQNKFQLVYDQRVEGLNNSSLNILDGKMLYEQDDTFEDDGDEWQED